MRKFFCWASKMLIRCGLQKRCEEINHSWNVVVKISWFETSTCERFVFRIPPVVTQLYFFLYTVWVMFGFFSTLFTSGCTQTYKRREPLNTAAINHSGNVLNDSRRQQANDSCFAFHELSELSLLRPVLEAWAASKQNLFGFFQSEFTLALVSTITNLSKHAHAHKRRAPLNQMDPKQAIQYLLISIVALVILGCCCISCESVCSTTEKCGDGLSPESSSRSDDAPVKEDAFYDVENLTEVKKGESDSGEKDKDDDDSASTATFRSVDHQDGEE